MLVSRYEQHALSDGGLAGIDVGNDPDVAKVLKFTCHCLTKIRRAVIGLNVAD